METSSIETPFPGRVSVPDSLVPLFKFLIFLSYLPSKTMGCFSGRLMSVASDQKLFCKLCSPFCCSFDESVEEKVISPSYSSAILTPPSSFSFLWLSLFLLNLPSKPTPSKVTNNTHLHPRINDQGACLVAQMVKNLPAKQETQVQPLGWEDPWRREWQPTAVFLPG